jgi:GMP reductase
MQKNLFSYDNICLRPNYSDLPSRSEADTTVNFLGQNYNLPIIPANMVSVIDAKIARFLSENGYFYIMHRFSNTDQFFVRNFVGKANDENWRLISISTGVNEGSHWDINAIRVNNWRVDVICVDVAHGWHSKVETTIKHIKDKLPTVKVIAGNVVTARACEDLEKWGADAIKIMIGSGSICSTRYVTGFYIPHASCIIECAGATMLPLIADGGIKHCGDITKALVLGADMVMSGFLFASCIDSPAKIVNGKKQYFGSTSFQAKGENTHIEGKLLEIDQGITYAEKLEEIRQGLSSAISYAGGNNLSAFNKVAWGVI